MPGPPLEPPAARTRRLHQQLCAAAPDGRVHRTVDPDSGRDRVEAFIDVASAQRLSRTLADEFGPPTSEDISGVRFDAAGVDVVLRAPVTARQAVRLLAAALLELDARRGGHLADDLRAGDAADLLAAAVAARARMVPLGSAVPLAGAAETLATLLADLVTRCWWSLDDPYSPGLLAWILDELRADPALLRTARALTGVEGCGRSPAVRAH